MEDLTAENRVLYYVDAVWLGIVSLLGIIGNSLALCAVATTPSLRTSTQLHITILAGVDLVITAVIIPCRIATEYFSGKWPRHEPWCQFLAFAAIFFIGFSLQQLMFLSQTRYLRVTKSDAVYRRFTSKPAVIGLQVYAVCGTCVLTLIPLYSDFGSVGYSPKLQFCIFTGRNQQLLAAVSMVAALGMIPVFYGLTFLHVRAHRRRVDNWRGLNVERAKPRNTDSRRHEKSCTLVGTDMDTAVSLSDARILSVIPTGPSTAARETTIGLNSDADTDSRVVTTDPAIEMSVSVNSAAAVTGASLSQPVPVPVERARGKTTSGPTAENVKITRNLLLIFCAYMCCWLPWCILSLIEPYIDIPNAVYHVLLNMLWTNSCINPYLYASMSRNYRHAFKKCATIKCLFKR